MTINVALQGLVVGLFAFAALWPRVCVRIFMPYVSVPGQKALLTLRIVCVCVLGWWGYSFISHRFR
jgi:hypothetical protein